MLAKDSGQQIGAIAKASGVPIKTIRYYEELGLIQAYTRTEGGFRLFENNVLFRLNFIKRAQHLGLSLAEIKDFLEIRDRGNLPCQKIKSKLQEKLTVIEQQIQELLTFKQELKDILSGWEEVNEIPENIICPIIEQNSTIN